MFFGSHASPVQVAQYMLGGLLGMGVNTIVLPLLPKPFTNSNLTATLSAFGLAFAEWWAASFIDKNFGAAVGFGALINAGRQGLNSFVPGVGSTFGLSGRRGTGDFVDARFAVPQNPIYDAYMGIDPGMAGRPGGVANAYPSAYAA